MRVLPILFNTEMVRAILDDRKKATRRTLKAKIDYGLPCGWDCNRERIRFECGYGTGKPHYNRYFTPPYLRGDILYVRETWARMMNGDYWYKADGKDETDIGLKIKWRPSIHMPREAARIWLRVTAVRVERLQEITVDGINSEGVDVEPPPICKKGEPTESERAAFARLTAQKQDEYISTLARHTYMGWCKYADDLFAAWKNLWDSTIKPADRERYGWAANPWVWGIAFERCEKPEEAEHEPV